MLFLEALQRVSTFFCGPLNESVKFEVDLRTELCTYNCRTARTVWRHVWFCAFFLCGCHSVILVLLFCWCIEMKVFKVSVRRGYRLAALARLVSVFAIWSCTYALPLCSDMSHCVTARLVWNCKRHISYL